MVNSTKLIKKSKLIQNPKLPIPKLPLKNKLHQSLTDGDTTLKRVTLVDFQTGVCLCDLIFDGWDGPKTLVVANLIKVFWQFSASIDGGGVQKVVLQSEVERSGIERRRFKSILRANTEKIAVDAPTPRSSKQKDDPTRGLFLVSCTDPDNLVISAVFFEANDLFTPHARRLARRVVDDFANEYVIELKRKEFKKMVSKIADNATKQEEQEKLQEKILKKFVEYIPKVKQFREEFVNNYLSETPRRF